MNTVALALALVLLFASTIDNARHTQAAQTTPASPGVKVWDFFVTNLLGVKPPEWNALDTKSAPIPTARVYGEGVGLFGQSWADVAAGLDASR